MDIFTPAGTVARLATMGSVKAQQPLPKMILGSMSGSFLLGFGCAIRVVTAAAPWFGENATGLIKTLAAAVFPVGLVMCFLTGSDLFTSYCMTCVVALLERRISWLQLLKTWLVSFFANLAAMLFFTIVLVGYGGLFDSPVLHLQAVAYAAGKVIGVSWGQIFLRGILANWLVCMSVFLSSMFRDGTSRILCIWFPAMTFTAIGADHVIANMFYIPLGLFLGPPQGLTVPIYIYKSMLPAAFGNMIGGGLFVGALFWYLYPTNTADEDKTVQSSDASRLGASNAIKNEV